MSCLCLVICVCVCMYLCEQLGIDSAVYASVTEAYLGAWWAAALGIIVAVVTLFAHTR
jgi:uncharacterized membrane protein YgaE (UPF0421/DUF939 family)